MRTKQINLNEDSEQYLAHSQVNKYEYLFVVVVETGSRSVAQAEMWWSNAAHRGLNLLGSGDPPLSLPCN